MQTEPTINFLNYFSLNGMIHNENSQGWSSHLFVGVIALEPGIVKVKNCTIGVKADNTLTADQQAWIGIGLVVFTALLCTGTCLTSLSSQDSNSFDCRKPQFSNQSSQQMKEII